MALQKSTIPIQGMHCRSCEILLEDALSAVANVKKCEVNWQSGTAQIIYSAAHPPSERELIKAVRGAGYNIGIAEKRSFFSQDPADYKDLLMAFLFLIGGYFILKGLNLPGISLPSISNGLNLPVVALIGLAAGFSTCLALVGGLVLGAAAKYAKENPEATAPEKFRVHILFNLGRIGGYMFFGALLGALGSVLQLSPFVTGVLTVLVGAVMLIMGLQLTNIVPGINSLKLTLPKGIARAFGIQNDSGKYSDNKSMLLGAMTFFLPCGFTQAMQLYAVSSGNFAAGALIMGLFALGTAPGLLSVGGLVSIFKKNATGKFFKFAGVVVVALAMFNISNGFNLTGWSNGITAWANSLNTTAAISNVNLAPIVNGQQVVNMAEDNSGYSPNEFTVKKGVPVKWVIDAQAPYSCAASIIMSKFSIRKNLQAGENIIEFTPTATGDINFSCSMGMYRGVFHVVDENGSVSPRGGASTGAALYGGGCGASAVGGRGGCGGCGGGGTKFSAQTATQATIQTDAATNEQVLKTTYTKGTDIQPNSFTVKAGSPVRLEIAVQDNGSGCMSSIMIPGLYNTAEYLQAGETLVMKFTPEKPGTYSITCAMGVPRGEIIVQ